MFNNKVFFGYNEWEPDGNCVHKGIPYNNKQFPFTFHFILKAEKIHTPPMKLPTTLITIIAGGYNPKSNQIYAWGNMENRYNGMPRHNACNPVNLTLNKFATIHTPINPTIQPMKYPNGKIPWAIQHPIKKMMMPMTLGNFNIRKVPLPQQETNTPGGGI